MSQRASVPDHLQWWVQQHPHLDVAAQAVALIWLAVAAVIGIAAIVYWISWIPRLLHGTNLRKFIRSPIPVVSRFKAAGQEIELAADQMEKGMPEWDGGAIRAVAALDRQVTFLSKAVADMQRQMARGEPDYDR